MTGQRVVVITGGGSGIGRACAAAFAGQGDSVAIIGRDEAKLRSAAEQIGKDVAVFPADVSQRAQVETAIAAIVERFGHVSVLVNAAGYIVGVSPTTPLDEAERNFDETIGVNLKGALLMALAVTPHLDRPGGRIINISSIAAVRGGGGMYSAAKAGVIGLTYALAGELGPEGITVNAIAPGLILDTEFFGDRMTNERLARTVAQIPMGRPGRPADIAAAARYLASPEASYVNGEIHHVNGGWVFGR